MKTFEQTVQEMSTWIIDRVEGKIPNAHMSNPVPYKTFKTIVSNQVNWCKGKYSFDQLAEALKSELLKHNIKVASGYTRNNWDPDQILQQQQQHKSSDKWEQAFQNNHYSITINTRDDNSIFTLVSWLYQVISQAHNNNDLKQICFSIDFKEVD